MSDRSRRVLLTVVSVVWVLALGASWRTLSGLGAWRASAERRHDDLVTLRGLGETAMSLQAQVEAVRARGAAGVPALQPVLEQAFPGMQPEDLRTRVIDLDEGWVRQEVEVALRDADASHVLAVVREVEDAHAPWRLASLELRASAHTPGRGDALLVFGAISRGR